LGRPRRSNEQLHVNLILRQFPSDPEESITFSELWERVEARGIGSRHTLSKYLKLFVRVGLITKGDEGYRLKRTFDLWEIPRETILAWGDKSIEDREAFLSILGAEFNLILDAYLEMLAGLIEIEGLSNARDYVSVFFQGVRIEDLLTFFAISVWKKRKEVPLLAFSEEGGVVLKLGTALEYGIVTKA